MAMAQSGRTDGHSGHFSAANTISVPNSPTEVIVFDVRPCSVLFLTVDVTTAILAGFEVAARPHRDANYVIIANAAVDFTVPEGRILDASGDLTTQPTGTTGWLSLDVRGCESVRIKAISASTSIVTICGGGN